MARSYGRLVSSQGIGTGSGALKTLIQYTAPSGVAVAIGRASISFDGIAPTAGKIAVEIVRGATGGTGTTLNPVPTGSNNCAGVSLGSGKENFTVEPSGGTVVFGELVHPQAGYTAPEEIVLAPGETIAIRVNAPAAVNGRPRFNFEV